MQDFRISVQVERSFVVRAESADQARELIRWHLQDVPSLPLFSTREVEEPEIAIIVEEEDAE